jgi:hypothetical protein
LFVADPLASSTTFVPLLLRLSRQFGAIQLPPDRADSNVRIEDNLRCFIDRDVTGSVDRKALHSGSSPHLTVRIVTEHAPSRCSKLGNVFDFYGKPAFATFSTCGRCSSLLSLTRIGRSTSQRTQVFAWLLLALNPLHYPFIVETNALRRIVDAPGQNGGIVDRQILPAQISPPRLH